MNLSSLPDDYPIYVDGYGMATAGDLRHDDTVERLWSDVVGIDPKSVPDGPSVYFMQCTDTLRIKIGFTKSVRSRAVGINNGSSTRIVLLLAIPGNEQLEKELHETFSDERVNHLAAREWYHASTRLVGYIRSRGGRVLAKPPYPDTLEISIVGGALAKADEMLASRELVETGQE